MTNCTAPNCIRAAESLGLCGAHYQRHRKGAPLDAPIGPARHGNPLTRGTCDAQGCDRPKRKRDWCNAHYQRFLTSQPIDGEFRQYVHADTCSVADCDRPFHSKGYCELHYSRMKNYGSLSAPPPKRQHETPNWAGDDVTYNGMHHRIRANLGRAALYPCSDCSAPARDWAYDHADPDEIIDPAGLPYSVRFEHYRPLCKSCHSAFDLGRRVP